MVQGQEIFRTKSTLFGEVTEYVHLPVKYWIHLKICKLGI